VEADPAAFLFDDLRPNNQPQTRIMARMHSAPITIPAIAPAPMPLELDLVLVFEAFPTSVPVAPALDEVDADEDDDVDSVVVLEAVLDFVLEDVLHTTALVAICETVW